MKHTPIFLSDFIVIAENQISPTSFYLNYSNTFSSSRHQPILCSKNPEHTTVMHNTNDSVCTLPLRDQCVNKLTLFNIQAVCYISTLVI